MAAAEWERRLHDYVTVTWSAPFAFGERDCALWALGAADVVRGTALRAQFAGRYDSAAGACALLAGRGWSTLLEAAAELLGPPLPAGARAVTGAAVWIPDDAAIADALGHGMLGVAVDGAALFPALTRLATVSGRRLAAAGARVVMMV